jgi:hypothetical protein
MKLAAAQVEEHDIENMAGLVTRLLLIQLKCLLQQILKSWLWISITFKLKTILVAFSHALC